MKAFAYSWVKFIQKPKNFFNKLRASNKFSQGEKRKVPASEFNAMPSSCFFMTLSSILQSVIK